MDASALEIGVWLGSGGAVMVIANQALKLVDRLKPHPDPSETYETKRSAEKNLEWVLGRVARVESDQAVIREKLDRMESQADSRAVKVHERIDQMERDISQIPHQVIALMKNSREI